MVHRSGGGRRGVDLALQLVELVLNGLAAGGPLVGGVLGVRGVARVHLAQRGFPRCHRAVD